jgi:amino acid permease
MAKYLLLSILIATIAVPVGFARTRSARKGMRRVVWTMILYIFIWVAFCIYLFLKLGGGY